MSSKAIAAFVTVLVLGALAAFLFLGGTAGDATREAREFDLRIAGRQIVEGPSILTASEGDTVTIRVRADEAEEFHLHGYDRSVDLVPGETAELTFTASVSGRFPFELERSKTEIGAIEILP